MCICNVLNQKRQQMKFMLINLSHIQGLKILRRVLTFCCHTLISIIILVVNERQSANTDICYSCKVYYEKKATSLWEVMFIVVKDLDVLSEVHT